MPPPPISNPVWVGQGGRNLYNRNVVHTLLFDFYTHYRPILHCLATIQNAADRQTDRAVEMGRLCYCIGGLKQSALLAAAVIMTASKGYLPILNAPPYGQISNKKPKDVILPFLVWWLSERDCEIDQQRDRCLLLDKEIQHTKIIIENIE